MVLLPGSPSDAPKRARDIGPARGTCRAIVEINGIPYVARPVPVSEGTVGRLFRLRKPDGTTYYVSQHDHGAECDCPDFVFHRNGLDPAGCKHIRALRAYGMLDSGSLDFESPEELPFGDHGFRLDPSHDDRLRFGPEPPPKWRDSRRRPTADTAGAPT